MPATHRRPATRGHSLVETMIALGIASVAAGLALPGWGEASERRRVEGAAAELETHFAHARSQAVAMNRTLRLHFVSDRCYVVHTGGSSTACSCADDGSASCSSGAQVLQVVQWSADTPVRVLSNRSSIGFDALKGTVTPTATVKIVGAGGTTLHNVINIMGRVRSCAPEPGLPGHTTC
ncbi:GspH/FimT family pseudopilin [Rubrivivax sp. RP6-9]|uniref:GspH/FimT family pseudopilin n=1 Tax=Rubrivivax sp. RP6-9 TaxID=3415750 RepID=UPI003CC5DAA1